MGSKKRASASHVSRRAFFGGLAAGSVAMAGTALLADSVKAPASAAGPSITPTGGELDAIVKQGTLKAGIFLQYPPLQFRNANTRAPEGFDVDLANVLAKDMGVKLDLVDMEWNSLIPGLYANKYHIILASMVPTPTRALAVDFSRHIEQFYEVLMVRKDSAYKTYDDLNKPGKVVTYSTGSVSDYAAHRFFKDSTLKGFDQIPSVLQVQSGQADAVVIEDVFAVPYVKEHPELRIIGLENPLTGEPASIGVRKGQQELLNFINSWIGYREARGELQDLMKKWSVSPARVP